MQTILIEAIKRGDVDTVREMLDTRYQFDVNTKMEVENTTFSWSLWQPPGADWSIGPTWSVKSRPLARTALYYAVSYYQKEILEYLVNRSDVDPNILCDDGDDRLWDHVTGEEKVLYCTALHKAIQRNDPEQIRILLRNPKVDPNLDALYAYRFSNDIDTAGLKAVLYDPRTDVNRYIHTGHEYKNSPANETLLYNMLRTPRIHGKEILQLLLKHPRIDVNKTSINHDGTTVAPWFHVTNTIVWRDWDIHCGEIVEEFFQDKRICLACLDEEGNGILDKLQDSFNEYEREFEGHRHYEAHRNGFLRLWQLIKRHELERLSYAKRLAEYVEQWTLPQSGKNIPQGLFTTNLLPFIADVFTPIEELENPPSPSSTSSQSSSSPSSSSPSYFSSDTDSDSN